MNDDGLEADLERLYRALADGWPGADALLGLAADLEGIEARLDGLKEKAAEARGIVAKRLKIPR